MSRQNSAKNVAKSTGLNYANLILAVSPTEYDILRKYSNETDAPKEDAEELSTEDLDTFPDRITVDTIRLLSAENPSDLPITMKAFKLLFADVDMRLGSVDSGKLDYGTTVELLGTMDNEAVYYVGITTNFMGTTHYVAETTMGDLPVTVNSLTGKKKTVEVFGDREYKLEKVTPGVYAVKAA
jgi:hypothetical protein